MKRMVEWAQAENDQIANGYLDAAWYVAFSRPPPLSHRITGGELATRVHAHNEIRKTCQSLQGPDPITIGPPYKATARDNRATAAHHALHVHGTLCTAQHPSNCDSRPVVLCPRHNHTFARQDREPPPSGFLASSQDQGAGWA